MRKQGASLKMLWSVVNAVSLCGHIRRYTTVIAWKSLQYHSGNCSFAQYLYWKKKSQIQTEELLLMAEITLCIVEHWMMEQKTEDMWSKLDFKYLAYRKSYIDMYTILPLIVRNKAFIVELYIYCCEVIVTLEIIPSWQSFMLFFSCSNCSLVFSITSLCSSICSLLFSTSSLFFSISNLSFSTSISSSDGV